METLAEPVILKTPAKNLRPPKLPKELEQLSYSKTVCFILYSLAMFIVPALLAYQTWMSTLPFAGKGLLMFVLLFFSQQGLHLLGWVGHEGFHLNLHRNKYISAYMGIFFASIIFSFMQIGASISHWNHHAFTNQQKDPDVAIFTRFKNFWSRILFARLFANRIYLKNTIGMAMGKKLDYQVVLPFTPKEAKILAITNLVLSAIWIGIYLTIIFYYPVFGIICIILPHILSILYTSIRSYLEHADTGHELFDNTRTRNNIFFTLFYFGNNYHLEHHLYPRVPCYQLPAVHQFLKENGYFKSNSTHIVSGIMEAYKFATGKHKYPEGSLE